MYLRLEVEAQVFDPAEFGVNDLCVVRPGGDVTVYAPITEVYATGGRDARIVFPDGDIIDQPEWCDWAIVAELPEDLPLTPVRDQPGVI